MPFLGGPALPSIGDQVFSCVWGGRKGGSEEGKEPEAQEWAQGGGAMSGRWSWWSRNSRSPRVSWEAGRSSCFSDGHGPTGGTGSSVELGESDHQGEGEGRHHAIMAKNGAKDWHTIH